MIYPLNETETTATTKKNEVVPNILLWNYLEDILCEKMQGVQLGSTTLPLIIFFFKAEHYKLI